MYGCHRGYSCKMLVTGNVLKGTAHFWRMTARHVIKTTRRRHYCMKVFAMTWSPDRRTVIHRRFVSERKPMGLHCGVFTVGTWNYSGNKVYARSSTGRRTGMRVQRFFTKLPKQGKLSDRSCSCWSETSWISAARGARL
jgi:hypothetical protein